MTKKSLFTEALCGNRKPYARLFGKYREKVHASVLPHHDPIAVCAFVEQLGSEMIKKSLQPGGKRSAPLAKILASHDALFDHLCALAKDVDVDLLRRARIEPGGDPVAQACRDDALEEILGRFPALAGADDIAVRNLLLAKELPSFVPYNVPIWRQLCGWAKIALHNEELDGAVREARERPDEEHIGRQPGREPAPGTRLEAEDLLRYASEKLEALYPEIRKKLWDDWTVETRFIWRYLYGPLPLSASRPDVEELALLAGLSAAQVEHLRDEALLDVGREFLDPLLDTFVQDGLLDPYWGQAIKNKHSGRFKDILLPSDISNLGAVAMCLAERWNILTPVTAEFSACELRAATDTEEACRKWHDAVLRLAYAGEIRLNFDRPEWSDLGLPEGIRKRGRFICDGHANKYMVSLGIVIALGNAIKRGIYFERNHKDLWYYCGITWQDLSVLLMDH